MLGKQGGWDLDEKIPGSRGPGVTVTAGRHPQGQLMIMINRANLRSPKAFCIKRPESLNHQTKAFQLHRKV